MGRFIRDFREHLQEVSWALFLLFLLLAGLAVIFGRCVGVDITLWVCLGFALVVSAIFAVIVLGNLIWVLLVETCRRLSGRK